MSVNNIYYLIEAIFDLFVSSSLDLYVRWFHSDRPLHTCLLKAVDRRIIIMLHKVIHITAQDITDAVTHKIMKITTTFRQTLFFCRIAI